MKIYAGKFGNCNFNYYDNGIKIMVKEEGGTIFIDVQQ
jgi:hypothetical protein